MELFTKLSSETEKLFSELQQYKSYPASNTHLPQQQSQLSICLEWVCRSSLLSYILIITLPTQFSRKITPLQARVGWCRGSAIYFYYSFKPFLTQNLATSAQPRPGLHDVKVAKICFLSNFGLSWQQLEGGQKRNIFVHGHWHDASLLHDIIHLKASASIVIISKWGC